MAAAPTFNPLSTEELERIFDAAARVIELREAQAQGRQLDVSREHFMDQFFGDSEGKKGLSKWKIYNGMHILDRFSQFEEELGKERFQEKPLWRHLAEKKYAFSTIYAFADDRYQLAPQAQTLAEVLEGTRTFESLAQIERFFLNWLEEHNIPLPSIKPRKSKKAPSEAFIEHIAHKEKAKNTQKRTRELAETHEKQAEELPAKAEGKKLWPERMTPERATALFRAAEELIQLEDRNELALSNKTLASYMKERYNQFSDQQIFQAMRIIRMLSPYQAKIGERFQFAIRPIYLQLLDEDGANMAISTIYILTKQRYQILPMRDILKALLTKKLQFSNVTKLEKYLEEQYKSILAASPVPITVGEEEEEQVEEGQEEKRPQPASTVESFQEHLKPWSPLNLPPISRFKLTMQPTPDGKRKVITAGNRQLTRENLYNMRIYVVGMGSNGAVFICNGYVNRSRDRYTWKKFTVKDLEENPQETMQAFAQTEQQWKPFDPQNEGAYISFKLREKKKEMEQAFLKRYPHPKKSTNPKIPEKPYVLAFEEIYANSRTDVKKYFKSKDYLVVELDYGEEDEKERIPKKKGRKPKTETN